jgi:hypothetical protein
MYAYFSPFDLSVNETDEIELAGFSISPFTGYDFSFISVDTLLFYMNIHNCYI